MLTSIWRDGQDGSERREQRPFFFLPSKRLHFSALLCFAPVERRESQFPPVAAVKRRSARYKRQTAKTIPKPHYRQTLFFSKRNIKKGKSFSGRNVTFRGNKRVSSVDNVNCFLGEERSFPILKRFNTGCNGYVHPTSFALVRVPVPSCCRNLIKLNKFPGEKMSSSSVVEPESFWRVERRLFLNNLCIHSYLFIRLAE